MMLPGDDQFMPDDNQLEAFCRIRAGSYVYFLNEMREGIVNVVSGVKSPKKVLYSYIIEKVYAADDEEVTHINVLRIYNYNPRLPNQHYVVVYRTEEEGTNDSIIINRVPVRRNTSSSSSGYSSNSSSSISRSDYFAHFAGSSVSLSDYVEHVKYVNGLAKKTINRYYAQRRIIVSPPRWVAEALVKAADGSSVDIYGARIKIYSGKRKIRAKIDGFHAGNPNSLVISKATAKKLRNSKFTSKMLGIKWKVLFPGDIGSMSLSSGSTSDSQSSSTSASSSSSSSSSGYHS